MRFVLDSSVTACWALESEDDQRADYAMDRIQTSRALVPWLWWFEVRNTLVINERRLRITERQTELFLQKLARFPIQVDGAPSEAVVLRLARAHRLSVYDAAYLELAWREGLPLATLDRQLGAAARAEGVAVLGEDA